MLLHAIHFTCPCVSGKVSVRLSRDRLHRNSPVICRGVLRKAVVLGCAAAPGLHKTVTRYFERMSTNRDASSVGVIRLQDDKRPAIVQNPKAVEVPPPVPERCSIDIGELLSAGVHFSSRP